MGTDVIQAQMAGMPVDKAETNQINAGIIAVCSTAANKAA